MYHNYEPNYDLYEPEPPQRCHSIEDVTTPVDPSHLASQVVAKLRSFPTKIVVPSQTPEMVKDLGRGFNKCIEHNKSNDEPHTYVFSPKTGSAKSVSAKMYVALLKDEASIIVVSKITDAINFCNDINNWSGDKGYARCYYSIDDKNPFRVEKKDLYMYRCIVITHNMFIKENNNVKHGYFKSYRDSNRSLVIVDERISMYNRHKISKVVVEDLVRIFTLLKPHIKTYIDPEITLLEEVVQLFGNIKQLSKQPNANASNLLLTASMRKQLSIPQCDFTILVAALNSYTKNLHSLLNPVRTKKNDEEDKALRNDIKNYLSNIETVLSENFSYHKSGLYSYLMSTENIISKFGTAVILDATAEVNEIYNTTAWHNSDTFRHIATVDPRKYSNFTIHKASGYPQSKYELLYKPSKKQLNQSIDNYLSIARSLLTSQSDHLLIISIQEFRDKLEKKNTNSRIEFTHWGDHIGKNDWSHCNKVMVIGWQELPSVEYYGNFINAVEDLKYAASALDEDMEKEYRYSQIADDLVQGVMRGSARKTISTDGNCYPCDAYLFYPNGEKGDSVMELFESQFKDAVVSSWNPSTLSGSKKLSKPQQDLQEIMTYLAQASKSLASLNQSDIVNNTPLKSRAVSMALNHPDCIALFQSKGYTYIQRKRGQSNIINL